MDQLLFIFIYYIIIPIASILIFLFIVIVIIGIVIKLSPRLNQIWFAFTYSTIIRPVLLKAIEKFRGSLLSDLPNLKSADPQLRGENSIRILEIGTGEGANLKYYPNNCHFISVDINSNFEKFLNDAKEKNPHVIVERCVNARGEDLKEYINDNSVDVVVMVYVLCYSNDIDAMLREAHRVLAKGGKLYILQHVVFKKTIFRLIQKLINPLFKLYFGGCSLLTDPIPHMNNIPWSNVEISSSYTSILNLPLLIERHVLQLKAIK